jgi:hypothetical protein
MSKHGFWFTFLAVFAGIWIYSRYKKTGTISGVLAFGNLTIKPAEASVFNGPDVDPVTGAYVPPNAQAGTSSFPVQPVGG